jgi:DNA helicase-2/ATP-dependent DNA helicase PcrA
VKIDLSKLNDAQREAVMAGDGVYQINAVAGSGKTTVLTNRVQYLISYHGVEPASILLTTFSKKAADEIKERMTKLINKRILDEIVISTFHSIGHRILKFEYKKANNPMYQAFEKDAIGGKPQKWMIEAIMKDLNIATDDKDALTAAEALRVISLAKNELLDVARFSVECVEEKDFQIAEIYRLYEEKKKEEQLIDFDDMLLLLYKLFKENPLILAKYQNKFKYIMVDEAQDNNYAQYQLIRMLGEKHGNIFLVGDDDQSMYGFRGARPEEFVNFKNTYKNVTIISLEQNYRSLPGILDIANKLIEKNTMRLVKKLIGFFKSTTTPTNEVKYYEATDEDNEAEQVANRVMEIVATGKSYKDCSVIFRTSAQTRALEDHFIRNSIPYVIIGGMSFYERNEVKDMIAYMNLAVNPHDNESFKKVVNTPSRYLGKAFIATLETEARKRKCSLFDALKTVKLTPYQHRNVMSYYDVIANLNVTVTKGTTANNLIKEIRNLTNYDEYLKKEGKEEDNDVLENLNALEVASAKHSSPKEFLNFIKILTATKLEKADAVKLMTIHKAKGLEFVHTLIVGFCNGLLPHRFALESQDPMAIEEERRLAYVAITRARESVDLFAPSNYNGKPTGESIFTVDCELKTYLVSA